MEIVKLKIKDLQTNIGQIPDLPMNPREWTQADVDRLAASLRETPELFEARPVLVVPQGKKYVILGGNMRYEASKKNGESEIPAIIFPADTPTAKLKELVIKDNGNFGNWSFDALANEWDDLPLTDWGVPAWKTEEDEEENHGEELRDDFSQRIGEVIYEPKETNHKISDLYEDTGSKFYAAINALKNEELKEMLRLRAAWFTDFNFAKIADYYAYQASPEEQRVIESLGLVLLDKDQLIDNGFADIKNEFDDETNH